MSPNKQVFSEAFLEQKSVLRLSFASIYGGAEPSPAPSPKRPPRNDVRTKRWRRGEWQDALFDTLESGALTHLEFAVGMHLSRRANNETGECWPSIRTIAQKVRAKVDKRGGCSSISRAIAKLKRLGLLEVRQRLNSSSFYTLMSGDSPSVETGTPRLEGPTNSVKGIPPLTESENSFEGRADNHPPIVLDDEMRKIAVESEMDDWAVPDQFERWLVLNKDTRLHHPKSAWAKFCEKYERQIGRDFEGYPEWSPELRDLALANGIPDEREAVRWFHNALKKRERGRKGKKREPIRHVVNWWKISSKGWHMDRRQQDRAR
jgi:Helix-turn-helix domain